MDNATLDLEVGTEEGSAKLEAKPVKVISVAVKPNEKYKGDTLVVMVKHPDKPEPFQLYNVTYQKVNSLKTVGFSIYLDSQKKLLKGTAPAEILRVFKLAKLKDMEGKEFPTILSSKGYLSLKAY